MSHVPILHVADDSLEAEIGQSTAKAGRLFRSGASGCRVSRRASEARSTSAAFFRNLICLAEQTASKVLPIAFTTLDGAAKRMYYGCVKDFRTS
jgi:hypothetical protein